MHACFVSSTQGSTSCLQPAEEGSFVVGTSSLQVMLAHKQGWRMWLSMCHGGWGRGGMRGISSSDPHCMCREWQLCSQGPAPGWGGGPGQGERVCLPWWWEQHCCVCSNPSKKDRRVGEAGFLADLVQTYVSERSHLQKPMSSSPWPSVNSLAQWFWMPDPIPCRC